LRDIEIKKITIKEKFQGELIGQVRSPTWETGKVRHIQGEPVFITLGSLRQRLSEA